MEQTEDSEFVERFEDGTLSPSRFHHRDHVRLAWLYLQDGPLLEALGRISFGLKKFAAQHGHPERYHETITWALTVLIHDRMTRGPQNESFDSFRKRNPELFQNGRELLSRLYDQETLDSPDARNRFVLP